MSTHRQIDRICAAAAALSLLLTVLFMNGRALGLRPAGGTIGYEDRLFDASRVHTVELVMDDWEGFLAACQSEEYSVCAVVIDGESYKNVGIRGKGNTSLSSVAAMGSTRYSFKLEFDHYDGAKSYHGLDKLSLNNLIQDNTMMKDYLTYRMMNAFGVPSPLSSFVYITVNGEDWGLYLAVEGVEEAFLRRNYGGDYGELYKPDSMSFGGGRGNGREFDMNGFAGPSGEAPSVPSGEERSSGGFGPPSMPEGGAPETAGEALSAGQDTAERPPDAPQEGADFGSFDPSAQFGGGPNFGGASDVKLQYIGDDPDSYSNIFDNAKTDVSGGDQARLIASLKALSSYENLEDVLDMEAVLRYFVVHNFVVNGDSYTGNMIHNYYLYEEDGRLSMIPWDYNLAFGTFTGGAADSAVNDAIDNVLSDRPMQAWIFSSEAYTRQYHQLYAEFLDAVQPSAFIDEAYGLIADYVAKDPTKFCTTEEFETGVQALRSFCSLRRESVHGQLAGTVPSTSEEQNREGAALVRAEGLNLSDMGTMNSGGMGGGPGKFGAPGGGEGQTPPAPQEEAAGAPGEGDSAQGEPDIREAGGSSPEPGGGEFSPPGGQAPSEAGNSAAILLGASVIAMLIGLLIAFKYYFRI